MTKRLLSLLFTLMMIVGVMTGFALTAGAEDVSAEAAWGADADNLTNAGSFAEARAAAAAENAGTVYIQLQKDIAMPKNEKIFVNVSPGTTLTLDFNGHTVSGCLAQSNFTLFDFNVSGDAGNGGEKLILLDSSDNSDNTGGIRVSEGSPFVSTIPLVVESGVYEGSGCSYAESSSSVVIKGGTFRSTESDALHVRNVDTLTINDGTFSTEDAYAFSCYCVGDVTINGGNFSHGTGGAMLISDASGEATAFKLYGDTVITDAAPDDSSADIVLESENAEAMVDLSAWTDVLDVKIGEYSAKPFPVSGFTLPDGWDLCKADGTAVTSPAELVVGQVYTLKLRESAAEARWGTDEQHLNGYGMLEDAVKAVETGTVRYVRLMKDVTLPLDASVRFELPEMETEGDPLIFDFNGHTITGRQSNEDFALFDIGYSFAQGAILRDTSDNPGGITAEAGRPFYTSNIAVVEGGIYTGSKPASIQSRMVLSEETPPSPEIKGGTFRTTGEYSFEARGEEVIISGGTFYHGTTGAILLNCTPLNLSPVLKLSGKIDIVDETPDTVSADLCVKGLYQNLEASFDLSAWTGGPLDVIVPSSPGWPAEYQPVFDAENITLRDKWGLYDSEGSAVTGTLKDGVLYTVKLNEHNVVFYDNSESDWQYVMAAFEIGGEQGYEQGERIGESSLYFFEIPEEVTTVYFTNYMPGMPSDYYPEGPQRTDNFVLEPEKTYEYVPGSAGESGGEGEVEDPSAPSIDPAVLQMIMAMLTKKFTPDVTASEGGTVTADRSSVRYNQDITYTITPDEGYAVADVIVNGESVGAVSEYTFENVRKQHRIEVVFEKIGWKNPYSDITEADWFYEDVAYVSENGIMNGVIENDTFAPGESASRAMLITTLWRLAGEPVVNYAMNFADVPQDMWYSEAVRWAASERIVQGYDGRFNPDDAITREELAVILYRFEQKMGGGFKGMWMFPLRYSDAAEVSEWAYEAICWLTMKGIYVSVEEGVLNPAAEATRADIAAFLHRYCVYRAEQETP